MKLTPRIFTTRLRVRYAETDQMGVVYHSNYLVWFEVGRVELMRELGFAYKQMEADDGCVLPVVEVSCRYRSPARYDDELELETCVTTLRSPLIKFAYQLWRRPTLNTGEPPSGATADPGTLLAEATTTHVVVDRELKRRSLPEPIAAALLESLT